MIKYILTFIGGATVGAGACYFIVNKKFEKKYDDKLTESVNHELKKINELYSDIEKQQLATKGEEAGKEYASCSSEEEQKESIVTITRPNNRIPAKEATRTSYQAFFRNDPAESESPTDDDPETDQPEDYKFGKDASEAHERDRRRGPQVIPESEYGEYMGYDQTELLFYPEQRILVDEARPDEEIYDIESIVGDKLDMVDDKYMSTHDYILIRNFRLSTDYKIFFVDGMYNMPGR